MTDKPEADELLDIEVGQDAGAGAIAPPRWRAPLRVRRLANPRRAGE